MDENHAGDLVNVTATDPETTHTDYTLALGGTHSGSFTLNSTGATGVLSFTNPPDHEAREVYRLTLTASNAMESSTLAVTVTVGDVNEPPEITLASAAGGAVTVSGSAVSVEENHTSDLVNVTATDPETTHTDYTLALGGTHSGSFTLNSTGGAGVLSFTNPPDHEVREVYRLTLTASNASESSTLDVTVTVRDVNEPPGITLASAAGGAVTVSGSAVSVEENHTSDLVNVTATDPETTHTDYTLALGGTHATSFTLSSTGGAGVLSFTNPPDHEAREVYRLTLTASNASESSTLDVTVTVRDVNEPPIDQWGDRGQPQRGRKPDHGPGGAGRYLYEERPGPPPADDELGARRQHHSAERRQCRCLRLRTGDRRAHVQAPAGLRERRGRVPRHPDRQRWGGSGNP